MQPRSSFAGAAIEVSDLARSIAFHRLWLPMLGFRRVWASPDRVMWSRGYDHFVMRQAKDGVSYGPGALWLAVSAESRAQVDQIYRRAARRRGGDPAAAQGARLLRAGLLLGRLPRSRRRADRGRAPLGRAARAGRRRAGARAGPRRQPRRLLLQAAGRRPALSGADPAARLRRPCPQHGGPGARRIGQRLRRPGAVAARLAGLGGRERPGPAPAARRAGGDRLAGQAAAGRPRPAWRWSAPRWAARWRCWPPPTSRRSQAVASFFAADRSGALARGQPVRARLSRRPLRARGPAGALADPAGGADRRAGAADPRRPRRERAGRPDAWPWHRRSSGHGKDVETFIVPAPHTSSPSSRTRMARRKLFDFLRRHLNRS